MSTVSDNNASQALPELSSVAAATFQDAIVYLNMDATQMTEDEKTLMRTIVSAAKGYIADYIGSDTPLSTSRTLIPAFYVLVQDMWDNRTMYVDKGSVNKTVQTILDMYRTVNIA